LSSLVGANTGSLEGLRAQLFILVGDEVDAEREVVDGRTLSAEIEDSDLRVRHTTVEARLGVRLYGKLSANLFFEWGHLSKVFESISSSDSFSLLHPSRT